MKKDTWRVKEKVREGEGGKGSRPRVQMRNDRNTEEISLSSM